MKRLGVLLLALASATWAPTAAAQKPRAERPTYTLGEKWIRSDGVFDLIRIGNDGYVFAAEGGREVHLTKDLAIFKIVRRGEVEFEVEPAPPSKWPLEVGSWGQVRLSRPQPLGAGRYGVAMLVWQVEAYETVQVPAGAFQAFRITETFRLASDFGKVTMWYAPGARQIIKAESHFIAPSLLLGPVSFPAFQVVDIEQPGTTTLLVKLDRLPDQARLTSERLTLAGRVRADRGVTRVTVALNGREISKEEDGQGARKMVSLTVPLQLQEGRNIVLVTAAEAGGETRQEARTVFYDRPAAAAAPPAPAAPPPAPFVVSLSSPADQAHVDQDTIGLSGVVSGGTGVSRVTVTVNGAEVPRQSQPALMPAAPINTPLKLRAGQNTVVVTAMEPNGTVHQEVRTVHYDRPVPLNVAIRYPVDGAQVNQESSVVAGLVTSSKGVAKVTVSLNGAEVYEQSERTPQKSVAVTAPLTLRDGANAVVVTATEADGTLRQDVRTVVFQRPQVVAAAPSPQPPPSRDRWAVVIGVGAHESGDIPKLHYAVPDAVAIHQVLTGPGGFNPEHVLLLTDDTERKPTLRNIRWALGTFLSRSARKDDTVVIFFAGHGAPEVDLRGIERDGFSKYLIPSDADPEDLYSSALPMDDLEKIFGRIEAERIVAFLDTCYSGAAGGRTFAAKQTRSGYVDDQFLERLTRSKGRAIITASRAAEVSMELPELGHGVFTYYLVEGLRGAADLNHDGIVTVQELYEYLERQVSQKSRSVGGNQHPVMKGELEGVLPLVKVKGR